MKETRSSALHDIFNRNKISELTDNANGDGLTLNHPLLTVDGTRSDADVLALKKEENPSHSTLLVLLCYYDNTMKGRST